MLKIEIRPAARGGKASVRQRHTYRAARREEQKQRHRALKKRKH